MYTVDDIRNITFTKTFGGYKTSEVDDFIDICADTVEQLHNDNEDLKKKMEILANKVVEYRNDEDSIRTALLSAQRLGDTVLREANHKAGLILEDAKIKADKIEETAKQQIQDQIDELERLKKMVSDFKTQILGVYREHLAMIDVLPEYDPPAQEKNEEAVAETAEEVAPADEPALEVTVQPVEPEVSIAEPEEVAEDNAPEIPVFKTPTADEEPVDTIPLFAVEDADSAEPSRFSDLKFGINYNISDDLDEEEPPRRHGKRRK